MRKQSTDIGYARQTTQTAKFMKCACNHLLRSGGMWKHHAAKTVALSDALHMSQWSTHVTLAQGNIQLTGGPSEADRWWKE